MNSPDETTDDVGTALINGEDCFPDLEGLKEDFDIIYFLDLCAGVEAAILYDRLDLTRVGRGAKPILGPLDDAGVLRLFQLTADQDNLVGTLNAVFATPRSAELMERLRKANYWDGADIDLAISVQTAALTLPTDFMFEEKLGKTLPFRSGTCPSICRCRPSSMKGRPCIPRNCHSPTPTRT